jgi:hypothetical protein
MFPSKVRKCKIRYAPPVKVSAGKTALIQIIFHHAHTYIHTRSFSSFLSPQSPYPSADASVHKLRACRLKTSTLGSAIAEDSRLYEQGWLLQDCGLHTLTCFSAWGSLDERYSGRCEFRLWVPETLVVFLVLQKGLHQCLV